MSFIDPHDAEKLLEKITCDPIQLGKLYKSRKSKYLVCSVSHNEVEEMTLDGWQEYQRLKTKTKLRRKKDHSSMFEDDIWCQLYELGFRNLNRSSDFRLPYGKDKAAKQQIDVIAIGEDCILLFECKSSEQRTKPPSFKTEFEALQTKLRGFRKSLEQLFGKDKKVKYVFATRKYLLDQNSTDVKRLLSTRSFFYNDNTYEYVNSLIKSYKKAAHYQFLAMLFRGYSISNERIELPAIEGKMGGKTYYMFSIEPHILLKLGFILHRTRANEADMPTYQRLLVSNRLNGITKFIEGGGYFPNSIVLNFSKSKTRQNRLVFDPSSRGEWTHSRLGILKIPNSYAIAYIIDGQHRVYGYANSGYKYSNTIPVVAFQDLDATEQLDLFMQINENQKAVSATLRITLERDLYWHSDRADSRIKALRSSIIQTLGESLSGPLHGKISVGEDKALLAASPFAKALTQSRILPTVKGNQYVSETAVASLYNTNDLNHSEEMVRAQQSIVSFINLCYQFVSEAFSGLYFDTEGNFILSNRGTFAFLGIIGSLNEFNAKNNVVDVHTSPEDRFNSIKAYLSALLTQLENLSDEEKEQMFGKFGSGADVAWLRTFQSLVNKDFPQYTTPELVDWNERQDRQLQNTGRNLGETIEKYVKDRVIHNLKVLFGENWDLEIGDIQRECDDRAKKEMEKRYKEGFGRVEIPWTDMFFITDYKTIIERFWARRPDSDQAEFKKFEDLFSIDMGFGFKSRSDKIRWLSVFNSYRNNWAHAGTREKGLNREEVAFLEKLHSLLLGNSSS